MGGESDKEPHVRTDGIKVSRLVPQKTMSSG